MEIYKLAEKYEKLLKIAEVNTYQKLVKVHNLAQSLAVDPYSEMSIDVKTKVNSLVKDTAILADKAYQAGISAEELKFNVEKLKSKIGNLSLDPSLEATELGPMLKELQTIMFVDFPAQKPGTSTYQFSDEPKSSSWEDDQEHRSPWLVTPEMSKVVDDLVNQSHAPGYDSWPE